MACLFKETGVKLMELVAQIIIGVLVALGLSFLVMLGCMTNFKGKPDKVKNHKYNYWTMRCEICTLELYGSTQVSLNKSFMWHVTNRHGDAQ